MLSMIPSMKSQDSPTSLYVAFLSELRLRGFEGDISQRQADRVVFATDNSIYQVPPQAVVFPRHEIDVMRVATLAHEDRFHAITFTPRGGGTGTNGQSLTDGIAVDLSRHMNAILEINVEEGWARVQAGVVKDQLNAAVLKHGLFFAPELSPSTPTFAEAGVANYNVINYTGLWAPKGTPAPVLQSLQKEIGVAMQSPDIREFSEGIGAVPKVVMGEAFAKMLKENTQMWGRVASTAKVEKQ